MTNRINQIFKVLGLKPGEEFHIKGCDCTYYFDDKLNLYVCGDLLFEHSTAYRIIRGKSEIIKIPKFTKKDKIFLRYVIICGFNYIAKNKNGEIYMFKDKPVKCSDVWRSGVLYLRLCYDFSFISWDDDEPFNIEEWIREVV